MSNFLANKLGRAGSSGVSADEAQVDDAVAAEEAFYDGMEAQLSEDDDEDMFADPMNEYVERSRPLGLLLWYKFSSIAP